MEFTNPGVNYVIKKKTTSNYESKKIRYPGI